MGRATEYLAFLDASPRELELVKTNMSNLTITEELMNKRAGILKEKRLELKERLDQLIELHESYQKDYEGMSKGKKKESRMNDFIEEWINLLQPYYNIEFMDEQGCFMLTNSRRERFTYYPSSDRLEIHKGNQLKNGGLFCLIQKAGK